MSDFTVDRRGGETKNLAYSNRDQTMSSIAALEDSIFHISFLNSHFSLVALFVMIGVN